MRDTEGEGINAELVRAFHFSVLFASIYDIPDPGICSEIKLEDEAWRVKLIQDTPHFARISRGSSLRIFPPMTLLIKIGRSLAF